MRILVTDGDNRAALAVTRSLGRQGHEIIVGEGRTPALAQMSRYCAEAVVYPDPTTRPDAFTAFVSDLARDRAVDVVLPIADVTTFLITGARERFDPACRVPCPDATAIRRAADKIETMALAERIGVPVPRGVVLEHPKQELEADLGWPVVIKPHQSRVVVGSVWVSTAVGFAANREALARELASRAAHEFPVLIQERIVGSGVGVFACYHEGRPVAFFSHRRIRERPPWGGVSVLSESVELPERGRASATRLLDELKWHGVAMVEFKEDRRDGQPKLMEINGRFWGSLQLAIDAGVDFPGLLIHGVTSGVFPPQPPYRVGIRNRWFWGDVDALIQTLFGSRREPSVRKQARAVFDFMKLWSPGLHYENPRLDDLKPGLFETREWMLHGGIGRTRRATTAANR